MDLEGRLESEGLLEPSKDEGWDYVSNQAGGFWAFYWCWTESSVDRCQLDLQIEAGRRLQIRIDGVSDEQGEEQRVPASLRHRFLRLLQKLAGEHPAAGARITLRKSGAYRPGRSGAVVDVGFEDEEGFLAVRDDGVVDMGRTIDRLRVVMDLVVRAAVEGGDQRFPKQLARGRQLERPRKTPSPDPSL